jgi:hypothetical protein
MAGFYLAERWGRERYPISRYKKIEEEKELLEELDRFRSGADVGLHQC